MLDLTKPVRTRSGKRVYNIVVKRYSCGAEVTYPIKGTVILREKPLKTEYNIWSLDGIWDVVENRHPELDLIQMEI